MNAHSLTILLAALAAALPASAQVPGATRQVDEAEQRRRAEAAARAAAAGTDAPELYAGEAADLGPQKVFGLAPSRHHFEVSADVQFYHTDNFFLAEEPIEESTTVLLSTLDVALAPAAYPLGCGTFAPRVGLRHQWYNFGLETDQPFDVFDFRAQTIYAEGRFHFARGWRVEAGFDAQRLLNHNSGDVFYEELAPRWGLSWRHALCRSATVEAAYRGIYRITRSDVTFPEDANDRLDSIVQVSLAVTPCSRVVVQPYYRFQHTHYWDELFGFNRDGQLHSAGLGIYYYFADWCSLRGFFQYDLAEFRDPFTPDYRNFNGGGGVNLTLRF
jgi:hypothetical protein